MKVLLGKSVIYAVYMLETDVSLLVKFTKPGPNGRARSSP